MPRLRQHPRPATRAAAGRISAGLRRTRRLGKVCRDTARVPEAGDGRRRGCRSHRCCRRAQPRDQTARSALPSLSRASPATAGRTRDLERRASADDRLRGAASTRVPSRLAVDFRGRRSVGSGRTLGGRVADLPSARVRARMCRRRMRVAVPRHEQSASTAVVQHGGLRQPGESTPTPRPPPKGAKRALAPESPRSGPQVFDLVEGADGCSQSGSGPRPCGDDPIPRTADGLGSRTTGAPGGGHPSRPAAQ
jgi:hypothetical protein